MTDEELQAIRERCELTLPGPWLNPFRENLNAICTPNGDVVVGAVDYDGVPWIDLRMPEADFICTARQDIPALLTEVQRLRFDNAHLRRQS